MKKQTEMATLDASKRGDVTKAVNVTVRDNVSVMALVIGRYHNRGTLGLDKKVMLRLDGRAKRSIYLFGETNFGEWLLNELIKDKHMPNSKSGASDKEEDFEEGLLNYVWKSNQKGNPDKNIVPLTNRQRKLYTNKFYKYLNK